MPTLAFTLYIAGQKPRVEQDIATTRRLCAATPGGQYDRAAIGVPEQPQAAERVRALAAPTPARELPRRHIVGGAPDTAGMPRAPRAPLRATCGRSARHD